MRDPEVWASQVRWWRELTGIVVGSWDRGLGALVVTEFQELIITESAGDVEAGERGAVGRAGTKSYRAFLPSPDRLGGIRLYPGFSPAHLFNLPRLWEY